MRTLARCGFHLCKLPLLPAADGVPPRATRCVQVNPQFFAFNPDCQFDSFVTIGLDGPALIPGALSSVGITFEDWTERNGLATENGAVFFMVRRVASCHDISARSTAHSIVRLMARRTRTMVRRPSQSFSCS